MSVTVKFGCNTCGTVLEKAIDTGSPFATPAGWTTRERFGIWTHQCARCSHGETFPGFGDDDPRASASRAQREEES